MDINQLRLHRTELEEELDLWCEQAKRAHKQMDEDEYNRVGPSKTTKRQDRKAREHIDAVHKKLREVKLQIMEYTADRLKLKDLL